MLLLIVIGVIAFLILTKKPTATASTQRAQALQQAETGLLGSGINLLTSAVNKALSLFTPSTPASTGGMYQTQSTDIGSMFAPSDIASMSDLMGLFTSTPYVASDLNAYASI